MHYLCGTDIENLTILNKTTDFHNIGSICKVQNGLSQNDSKNLQVYTPKNTQETVKILQKYSNGLWTTVLGRNSDCQLNSGSFNSAFFHSKLFESKALSRDWITLFSQTINASMKQRFSGTVHFFRNLEIISSILGTRASVSNIDAATKTNDEKVCPPTYILCNQLPRILITTVKMDELLHIFTHYTVYSILYTPS